MPLDPYYSSLDPNYIMIPIAGGITRIHKSELTAGEIQKLFSKDYAVTPTGEGNTLSFSKPDLGAGLKDIKGIALLAVVALVLLKV